MHDMSDHRTSKHWQIMITIQISRHVLIKDHNLLLGMLHNHVYVNLINFRSCTFVFILIINKVKSSNKIILWYGVFGEN